MEIQPKKSSHSKWKQSRHLLKSTQINLRCLYLQRMGGGETHPEWAAVAIVQLQDVSIHSDGGEWRLFPWQRGAVVLSAAFLQLEHRSGRDWGEETRPRLDCISLCGTKYLSLKFSMTSWIYNTWVKGRTDSWWISTIPQTSMAFWVIYTKIKANTFSISI